MRKPQYAGAFYDTALGTYRMGVRWYGPGLGRFTNPDPSTKEANPYLYAAGDPINNYDPTGESWKGAIFSAVATKVVSSFIGKAALTTFMCAGGGIVGCAATVSLTSGLIGAIAGGAAASAAGDSLDDVRQAAVGGFIGGL